MTPELPPQSDISSPMIRLSRYGRDRFRKLRRAGKRAGDALQTLTPNSTPVLNQYLLLKYLKKSAAIVFYG